MKTYENFIKPKNTHEEYVISDICPYQQYLSCYWPDLDQTLNKGFWEQIQQITTVPTTFVQATFVLGTFVHISNISAVTGPIWIKL